MQQYKAVVKLKSKLVTITNVAQDINELVKKTTEPGLTINVNSNIDELTLDYLVLDNPRVVSLAGFGYDVDSGYLTCSNSEYIEHMGILNLDAYLDQVTKGNFNKSQFLYNLERFKLGEIENPSDIFEMQGAGVIKGTGSICKQYLDSVIVKKDDSTSSSNKGVYGEHFLPLFKTLVTALRGLFRQLEAIEHISDTGFLLSTYDSNMVQRINNIREVANSSTGVDGCFQPTAALNYYARKELNAKSTLKYLNMREVVSLSSDEDDKVMNSLCSTDEDIKKVVKASPSYKDSIKGAALSGVIKKKFQVIEGLYQSYAGNRFNEIADMFSKYSSYIKTVLNKVKI